MTENTVLITQGQQAVAEDRNTIISTLLGSCVACCIWDPEMGIGGMNHMLLAGQSGGAGMGQLADINEIEKLINGVVRLGGNRLRLQAKAFGGASMVSGLSSVGMRNAEFTIQYLESENIPVLSKSLGGKQARNIKFWPATGRVLMRTTDSQITEPAPKPVVQPQGNDMELF